MKEFLSIIKILVALTVLTFGCSNLSEPSNLSVAIGLFEISVALILLFHPLKTLIKQL